MVDNVIFNLAFASISTDFSIVAFTLVDTDLRSHSEVPESGVKSTAFL
jgi:hypothetical protein